MARAKELLERMNSVSLLQQITKAMKLISASKLNKAQELLYNLRNFVENLTSVEKDLDISSSKFDKSHNDDKLLVIAISSDKGFCGAFNNNICKKIETMINTECTIMPIGEKISIFVQKKTNRIIAENSKLLKKIENSEIVKVAKKIYDSFKKGNYTKVVVVYNKFISMSSQNVVIEGLLYKNDDACINADKDCGIIFESKKTDIVEFLKENNFIYNFMRCIYESNASEHAVRMITMNKASNNAESLNKKLKTIYNQARQASITNEIIEISAGAQFLNNN